jgi:surface polysaccharide O-acyltransferase-like enzyme
MRGSGTSLALSNLRAVVILIVVAVHSVLAYLDYATEPSQRFEEPPYRWLLTPIVDDHRWLGFDLFCAWQDVYLMSLLFFLSGCFVWTSLERKGSWLFVRDRLVRIGIPLAVAVAFLMPVALFPVYLRTGAEPSLSGYWEAWRNLPFWPCGPQWFLGILLSLNIVAAVIRRYMADAGLTLDRFSDWMRQNPLKFVVMVALASTCVYVPLALAFTPWTWVSFGPFSFQLSRPVHYAVYFFAGVSAGASGLGGGLLTTDNAIARHWLSWFIAAGTSFVAWIALTVFVMPSGRETPFSLQILNDVAFGIACASSCFFALALFLRFGQYRAGWSDSLSENAYGIYVAHYVFVVWTQYILLEVEITAFIKAIVVFAITLCASWLLSAGLSRFWKSYRSNQLSAQTARYGQGSR